MRLLMLLTLLGAILAGCGTGEGISGVGSAARVAPATHADAAQGTEPTWPPPPTPISDEQAEAIATKNARLYGPRNRTPDGRRCAYPLVHRASPSIRNLRHEPSVFIATVRGKGAGLALRRHPLRIYTPLDLRVERVIVDEIDPPTGFRYVAYGGTTPRGECEVVGGMHPPVRVGERYVFFMAPLTPEGGGSDPR